MLAALLAALMPAPAAAIDLLGREQITAHFATPDGKPMAGAEVRVFAPGKPDRPVLTGRTDSTGKFEFPADSDGFWSAEARNGSEVARIMIRVGGGPPAKPPSRWWLLVILPLLLVLAVAVRRLRARFRRPPA